MIEEDIVKTAICTPFGYFDFSDCHMLLSLSKVLCGLLCIFVNIVNILVVSNSLEEY